MHAIRLHEFGPAENLRYEELPDPSPGTGQVRIAVSSAGVHFIDTALRAGRSGPIPLPELPHIPGREVAGVVDALGPGTDPQWLGRPVVAHLGPVSGGYAAMAVTAAAAVHPIPDGVGADEAVAMIGTGRTTLAILEVAALTAGDVAVITAAAGGIGTLLVQAAATAGATVVGLAGGEDKTATVRANGAHIAVDYTTDDWPQRVVKALEGRTASVVLDGVGGTAGRAAMQLLGPGGRLVLFGYAAGEPTRLGVGDLYALGISATAAIGARLNQRPGGMRDLERAALAAAAAGTLRPAVQRFGLAAAGAAHAALESRATTGKVVLVPA
jgi:NADPH:quinone reductase